MAVYPEYLTDCAIAYCPSDAENGSADYLTGDTDPENGIPDLIDNPDMIDDSYIYFGWAFDRIGTMPPSDPLYSQYNAPMSVAAPALGGLGSVRRLALASCATRALPVYGQNGTRGQPGMGTHCSGAAGMASG